MSAARLYLGVDGGQSSTTALVGDESGNILGIGTAGPCNHVGAEEGPAKLKRMVSQCLVKLDSTRGIPFSHRHVLE